MENVTFVPSPYTDSIFSYTDDDDDTLDVPEAPKKVTFTPSSYSETVFEEE